MARFAVYPPIFSLAIFPISLVSNFLSPVSSLCVLFRLIRNRIVYFIFYNEFVAQVFISLYPQCSSAEAHLFGFKTRLHL